MSSPNAWELIYEHLRSLESSTHREEAIAEIAVRSEKAGVDLSPSDFVAIPAFPLLSPDVLAQVAHVPGIKRNGDLNSWKPAIATLLRDSDGEAFGINLRYLKAHLEDGDTKAVRLGGGNGKSWQERAGLLPGDSTQKTVVGAEGADFQAQYLNRTLGLPTYQGLGSGGAIYRDIDRIRTAREANGWEIFLLALDRPYKRDSETEINRSVAKTIAKNVIALRAVGFDVRVLSFYDENGRQIAPDDGTARLDETRPESLSWLEPEITALQAKESFKATVSEPRRANDAALSNADQQLNRDLIDEIAARIDVTDFERHDRILVSTFYKSIDDYAGFERAWAKKASTDRKYLSEMRSDWNRAESRSGDNLTKTVIAIAKRIGFNRSAWMKQWWVNHPEFKSRRPKDQPTPKPTLVKDKIMATEQRPAQPISEKAIALKDLVAPRTHDILSGKQLYVDEKRSFAYVARETVGWEHFAHKYGIPITGSSETFIQQAKNLFRFTDASVDRLLQASNLPSAVPSCVHVDSKEKGKYSETAAWAHIYKLDRDIFLSKCPDQIVPEVLDRLEHFRDSVEAADQVQPEQSDLLEAIQAQTSDPHQDVFEHLEDALKPLLDQATASNEAEVVQPQEPIQPVQIETAAQSELAQTQPDVEQQAPEPLKPAESEVNKQMNQPLKQTEPTAVQEKEKSGRSRKTRTPKTPQAPTSRRKQAAKTKVSDRVEPDAVKAVTEPESTQPNVSEPVQPSHGSEGDTVNQTPKRTKEPELPQLPTPNGSGSSDTQPPTEAKEISFEVEVPIRAEQLEIDRTLANLGRELITVAKPPVDHNNNKMIEGKKTHTVVLNLATDTLKIYSKERGGELILTDVNGKIDHANSKATLKDIETFQTALASLKERLRESQTQHPAVRRESVAAKR